jgi:type II secretory pathway pseudopilin PulG
MSNAMNAPTKRQGMAVTSLVLGILSVMCFGLLAGLPAIILGHTAHRRARKAPDRYTGAGLAVAGFLMGYASLITTLILVGILAGLSLPALARAKAKAQSIACMNNMKQIGLAFRVWANDHQDRFPFNASTNKDAALKPGEAGLDDPVQVFQMLSNELASPSILVCPADPSKRPAISFGSLQPSNISYELETGPEVKSTNPDEVLVRCPIHGHELHCDGSVQQTRWR